MDEKLLWIVWHLRASHVVIHLFLGSGLEGRRDNAWGLHNELTFLVSCRYPKNSITRDSRIQIVIYKLLYIMAAWHVIRRDHYLINVLDNRLIILRKQENPRLFRSIRFVNFFAYFHNLYQDWHDVSLESVFFSILCRLTPITLILLIAELAEWRNDIDEKSNCIYIFLNLPG